MNISTLQNTNTKLNFRGTLGSYENVYNFKNAIETCCIETHFMRDLDSTTFVTDYLKKTFPQGTHIADWGCSEGYETYTIGTLLHDSNQDKRYKITGYDLVPKNIKKAELGEFKIGNDDIIEHFLTTKQKVLTEKETVARKSFEACFQKDPKTKLYKPKKGTFDNIINFQTGDIFDIQKTMGNKSSGAVFFKNALYHLLQVKYSSAGSYLDNKSEIKNLFTSINNVLENNGLFILGSLEHDHILVEEDDKLDKMLKYQNGKQIQIFDKTVIHELLRECGFEPAFYDTYQSSFFESKVSKVHLPSVWKKVRNVI